MKKSWKRINKLILDQMNPTEGTLSHQITSGSKGKLDNLSIEFNFNCAAEDPLDGHFTGVANMFFDFYSLQEPPFEIEGLYDLENRIFVIESPANVNMQGSFTRSLDVYPLWIKFGEFTNEHVDVEFEAYLTLGEYHVITGSIVDHRKLSKKVKLRANIEPLNYMHRPIHPVKPLSETLGKDTYYVSKKIKNPNIQFYDGTKCYLIPLKPRNNL